MRLFYHEEVPKVDTNYFYLRVILINFVLKKDETAIYRCF